MTKRHDAILEAMQEAKAHLGVPYSDFGRWAVGDPRFRERVMLRRRLRYGEARRAFALALRLFKASVARLERELEHLEGEYLAAAKA